MKDEIRKALLAGLGVIGFSMDKAAEAVSALVERGEITAEQGKKVVKELAARAKTDGNQLRRKAEDAVRAALGKVTVVTQPQLKKLEARVAAIEKKLRASKKRAPRKKSAGKARK